MVLAATVTFAQVILALHIIAVVVAFGWLFADPLFMLVGSRLDPTAMPWLHQMQSTVGRRLVSPGLLLVLVFGIILASEWHAWHAFYVQWGVAAAIVIGAIEGMFVIPRTGRLADLARRDLGGDLGAGTVRVGALSAEYRAQARQALLGSMLVSAIVLVTIVLMALHVGG